MQKTGDLKVEAHGDTEIRMTRTFAAPRRLVFDAWTKPELLKRWLFGPKGWTLTVVDIDLRVGGKYRFVTTHTDGRKMGWGGVYTEVKSPERFVATELFDEPWYPGESTNTVALTEKNGKTVMVSTMKYVSRAARDGVLASPMEEGLRPGFDRMDEVVRELAATQTR